MKQETSQGIFYSWALPEQSTKGWASPISKDSGRNLEHNIYGKQLIYLIIEMRPESKYEWKKNINAKIVMKKNVILKKWEKWKVRMNHRSMCKQVEDKEFQLKLINSMRLVQD